MITHLTSDNLKRNSLVCGCCPNDVMAIKVNAVKFCPFLVKIFTDVLALHLAFSFGLNCADSDCNEFDPFPIVFPSLFA